MGTRTEHAPGTFSWVDLTTDDAAAAQEFYGGLFEWEFEDSEAPGGGGTYTMCKVDGEYVAAISPETDSFPPHWNSYVTVASADDAAAKARDLGATVIEPPFDVGEAGRMALFIDPTGAALCVWEPREAIGATRVNDPGSLSWNELHTPDQDRALEFYTGLFGWGAEPVDTQGGPRYTAVKVGDRANGAVMDAQSGEPPYWLPYFVVEDRDAAADKATALGAHEITRLDIPWGSIAVFTDPQGAAFAIFAGDVDD
jgi:predicted enzyme related to lactoylglutathione lyase